MLRFSLTVSYLKLLLDFFPLFHIVSLCNSTLHNPLFSQAERRMVSVYMPDERISMFPYALSTELLSLGAGVDSYALSCGVTLDANGTYVMRENVHRKDVRTNMVQTNGRRERVGYADNASCTHAHTHIDTAYFIQHISSFKKFNFIPDSLFGFGVVQLFHLQYSLAPIKAIELNWFVPFLTLQLVLQELSHHSKYAPLGSGSRDASPTLN